MNNVYKDVRHCIIKNRITPEIQYKCFPIQTQAEDENNLNKTPAQAFNPPAITKYKKWFPMPRNMHAQRNINVCVSL